MGQEGYLMDRELRWSPWMVYRPGWDHDHCEFCTGEFGPTVSDHVQFAAGYVTADDNYRWVCPQCFQDFREAFRWTVSAESGEGVPTARQIEAAFTSLIAGESSREETERWASRWLASPAASRMPPVIWWALSDVLCGIDLRHGPEQPYLFDESQILDWFVEFQRRITSE